MDWVSLIIANGLPVAYDIWKIWSQGRPPTDQEWQDLIAKGRVNARANMLAALARNGIDPASPQGVALLALTPP